MVMAENVGIAIFDHLSAAYCWDFGWKLTQMESRPNLGWITGGTSPNGGGRNLLEEWFGRSIPSRFDRKYPYFEV